MWMQDTMEAGYTQLPERSHVRGLECIRGYDDFGPTLLGPDMGVIRIGENRKLSERLGGLVWELEVTAPTDNYPLGRFTMA